MKVAIRADASSTTGHGHVVRCLTLAKGLADRGASVRFICRELDGHLCDLIEQRGFDVDRLPNVVSARQPSARSPELNWLGVVTWEDDAEQTAAALRSAGAPFDWLVVDHYGLDSRWEAAVRPVTTRILVIDDLANRTHDCDLLLDQNLVADMSVRYDSHLPEGCATLIGPRYALLQPDYADLHDDVRPRQGPVRRILVFFGGVDGANLTDRTLDALLDIAPRDLFIDVVASAASVDRLRQMAAGNTNVGVHSGLLTLAPLMAAADLAVGAAGTTTWERLCLGVPSIVVTMADNQRPTTSELDRRGLAWCMGDAEDIDRGAIRDVLRTVIAQGCDTERSARGLALVDGRGTSRVCAAMLANAGTKLLARLARGADEELVLEWANDPVTRRNGFFAEQISPEAHHRWFEARLDDVDGCRLYIIQTEDSVPVGQVRFERISNAWSIGYGLASPYRGRGLGRSMLETALSDFREVAGRSSITGRVKTTNIASCRVFESLGFERRPGDGFVDYWLTSTR
jgi:UDP-2,4-diacetamido-2,4,6-trideoxy-beta-L-altropyranose hydrolase